MMKDDPTGSEKYFKNKDSNWVDNKSEVESVIKDVKESLEKTVKQLIEVPKKEVSIAMIEKPKFKVLESFLIQVQSATDTLARRLDNASMNPVGTHEMISHINKEADQIREYMESLGSKLTDLRKSIEEDASRTKRIDEDHEKELKEIEKFEKEMKEENAKLRSAMQTERYLSTAPAAGAAQALKFHIDYFNRIYNLFHSYFWFREKKVVKSEEEEEIKKVEWGEGIKDPAKWSIVKNKIVDIAQQIAETSPLRSSNTYSTIRSLINKIRPMLDGFILAFPKARSEGYRPPIHDVYAPTLTKKVGIYDVINAAEDREKLIERTIFPESELEYARGLISKLHQSKSKKLRELADKAETELNDIVKAMVSAFKEGLPIDELREFAEKNKITLDKARLELKKHQDTFSRVALRKFTDKWRDVLERGREKKEKSPLGNRPAVEYDKMGEFVERHIPELFTLIPEEEELEELPMAKPTKSDIMDAIMEGLRKIPGRPGEYYENKIEEIESFGRSKPFTEKAKSKKRPKAPKQPIPKGTWQDLKDQVVKIFTKESAEDIVSTVMAHHVSRLKKLIKEAKEHDRFVDPDDVIDSMISLLKSLKFVIVNMKITPSAEQMKMIGPRPSKGPTPEKGLMSEPPDIPIDTYKDAEKILDKIKDIYSEINYYIAPDKIGTPPDDISKVTYRPGKKDLPFDFAEWAERLRKIEEEKKASDKFLVQKITASFIESNTLSEKSEELELLLS